MIREIRIGLKSVTKNETTFVANIPHKWNIFGHQSPYCANPILLLNPLIYGNTNLK